MKPILLSILLAFVLVFAIVPAASAADGAPPVGSCPVRFSIHTIGMHEEHGHMHVGLTVDLNNDTQICVKHMGTYHIHVDNVIR